MKITSINAKEILDSQGLPTILCEVQLKDGAILKASVPSDFSKNKYVATQLRDGGKRLMGMGVTRAIENINKIIAPKFVGKDPNAVEMDLEMIQMDGSTNKSNLGANAILAVSMAIYRAHAYVEQLELFDLLALVSDSESVSLPLPMINFIGGQGIEEGHNLAIREFLAIPYGSQNIKKALESSVVLFYKLQETLKENNKPVAIGSEGEIISNFKKDTEPLDLILETIKQNKASNLDAFMLAIDVSAGKFYNSKEKTYILNGKELQADGLITFYAKLFENYNLFSIEDPLAEADWDNWQRLTKVLSANMNIVGDNIFATNPERIAYGIEIAAANTAVIKPSQIGTITESLQAIQLCKEAGWNTIAAHSPLETNDTFIVDLSIGASTEYLKCGGLSRGERTSKYNRLLEIETLLNSSRS